MSSESDAVLIGCLSRHQAQGTDDLPNGLTISASIETFNGVERLIRSYLP